MKKQDISNSCQEMKNDTACTVEDRKYDTIRTSYVRRHDKIRSPYCRTYDTIRMHQAKEHDKIHSSNNESRNPWWYNLEMEQKKENADTQRKDFYEGEQNKIVDSTQTKKYKIESKKEILPNDEWPCSLSEGEPRELAILQKDNDKSVETQKVFAHDKHSNADKKYLTLDNMEAEILKKIVIIKHDDCLYYFNGRSYQVIADDDQLLELIREYVSRDAFSTVGVKKFNDLIRFIKADKRLIPPDYEKSLKQAKHLVALKNGVLDLKTLKLMEHSPKFLVFCEIDAVYTEKPSATVFWKFLSDISDGDKTVMCRILEMMGYLFSPINAGKCFFVMGLAANSGKSTLGELISKILGERLVCHISPQQMSGQFGLGSIHGKILNLSMDLPKGKFNRTTVSLVKQITGGDPIVIEQKYQKSQEIHSKMRFLFSSNYPVTIPAEDDDDGFWNRMVIVPFTKSISDSKKDLDLLDKLYMEKDGIVSLCFKVCNSLIEKKYVFSNCPLANSMKNDWRFQETDNMWSIDRFISENLIFTGKKEDVLLLSDIYSKYQDFCYENRFDVITKFNQFRNYIEKSHGECKHIRSRQGYENARSCFSGVRWKRKNETD